MRLAGLYLDEDDGAAIERHQVEFTAAHAIAPGEDFVAAAAKIFPCGRLAQLAQRLRRKSTAQASGKRLAASIWG